MVHLRHDGQGELTVPANENLGFRQMSGHSVVLQIDEIDVQVDDGEARLQQQLQKEPAMEHWQKKQADAPPDRRDGD